MADGEHCSSSVELLVFGEHEIKLSSSSSIISRRKKNRQNKRTESTNSSLLLERRLFLLNRQIEIHAHRSRRVGFIDNSKVGRFPIRVSSFLISLLFDQLVASALLQ